MINLTCPINPKHTNFVKHYFEFYDSDDFVTNKDDLIKSTNRDEVLEQVSYNHPAARILHCIRCADCRDEDTEWSDLIFQKFQNQFFDQVGREFKETHYVNKIMDIVEGYDDDT